MNPRNLSQLGFRLEGFVRALFQTRGFTVERSHPGRDTGHDFTVHTGEVLAVVEVKLYRSMVPASRSIAQALEHLERARLEAGAAFGILATNKVLDEVPPEAPRTGAQLCADLHNVGKTVAKPFEIACDAAIRWLFRDGWSHSTIGTARIPATMSSTWWRASPRRRISGRR